MASENLSRGQEGGEGCPGQRGHHSKGKEIERGQLPWAPAPRGQWEGAGVRQRAQHGETPSCELAH